MASPSSTNAHGPADSNKIAKKPARGPNVKWSAAEDSTLLQVLEDEKQNGDQSESEWKKSVWVAVAERLKKDHPCTPPKSADKCITRFSRLKADYKEVHELREMSGFGWDEATQRVTAENEVWEALKECKASLRKWQHTSFPLYDRIHSLVGSVIATGSNTFRRSEASEIGTSTAGSGDEAVNEDNDTKENEEESIAWSPSPSITTATGSKRSYRGRTTSPAPRGKRRRHRSPSLNTVGALGDLTGAVKQFAAALTSPPRSRLDPSPIRRTRAYQVAEAEIELSDDMLVAAMKLFSKSTEAADAFLAFKKKGPRSLWLQEMLDKQVLNSTTM